MFHFGKHHRCSSALPPMILRTKVGAKSVQSRWRSEGSSSLVRRIIGGKDKYHPYKNTLATPFFTEKRGLTRESLWNVILQFCYMPKLIILALPVVVRISSLSLFCNTCFTSSATRVA